jgi:HEAT repeat protein/predicted MFS family arabinose efflux permease
MISAMPELSPGELVRARARFSLFAVLNVVAFTLLSGNVITLYLLRLGAGNFLIGLASSFMYTAYLTMLLGREMAPRWGMTRLMGWFWVLRYLCMVPMLFAPLAAAVGARGPAYGLVLASVFGFNAARGIAMTGYNPILGEIATERDRGAFLARNQTIQHAVTVALGVAMALVLGWRSSLWVYDAFIVLGSAAGLWGARLVFGFPEPPRGPGPGAKLWRGFAEALRQRTFRRFILLYFFTSLALYMTVPFLVVFVKEVYALPDSQVVYLTVVGSLGAVLMALASGYLIDRLGAKPLYFLFTSILTLTLLGIMLSPPLAPGVGVWLFAAALFLFNNMGQFGILNASQTYFLAAIRREDRLNLGVIYYMTLGVAGGIGSLAGGALLDAVGTHFVPASAFRLYFGLCAAVFLALLVFVTRLENLGAYPLADALGMIVSPRDLRAIGLLHRLGRSRSPAEVKHTLRALAGAPSSISVEEVLSRLRSPRFSVRAEALQALASLPAEEAVVQALVSEVKNHAFTTAAQAAEILGQRRIAQGLPALRRAVQSHDYILASAAVTALGQLEDRDSLPALREALRRAANPHLAIHAASALEHLRDPKAVPILLERLRRKNPPFLRDELLLALAGILGMGDWFYSTYSEFLEKGSTGISLLRDRAGEPETSRVPRSLLETLLERFPLADKAYFASLAAELLTSLPAPVAGEDVAPTLAEAIADPRLARLERFCFLIAAAIVWFSSRP